MEGRGHGHQHRHTVAPLSRLKSPSASSLSALLTIFLCSHFAPAFFSSLSEATNSPPPPPPPPPPHPRSSAYPPAPQAPATRHDSLRQDERPAAGASFGTSAEVAGSLREEKTHDQPHHRKTTATYAKDNSTKVADPKDDGNDSENKSKVLRIPVENRVARAKEFNLFDTSVAYDEAFSLSEDEVEASPEVSPLAVSDVNFHSTRMTDENARAPFTPMDLRTDPALLAASRPRQAHLLDPDAEYSTSFEDEYPYLLNASSPATLLGELVEGREKDPATGLRGQAHAAVREEEEDRKAALSASRRPRTRHDHDNQGAQPHEQTRPTPPPIHTEKGKGDRGDQTRQARDTPRAGVVSSGEEDLVSPRLDADAEDASWSQAKDGGDSPRRLMDTSSRSARALPLPMGTNLEARFRQPSDKLKSLITPQDPGEWISEKEEFEVHYPFHRPIEIRSIRTNERSVIVFEEVLGAGGQGVVLQARDVATKRGMALKVFRIRPDHRMDDRKDKDVLRRRVQSELAIWNHIPAGIEPRQWSNVAHLVIPLDVVEPVHPSPTPPKDQTRYAVQWVQMDLFAGDVARMTKIFAADASVKLEVTEQLFLATMRLHDLGLVHSDVKLANYFIGMDGRIFLGDHSLAHPRGANIACMLGTLRYLPPENMRCLSEGHRRIMTTERKDVWALGVVVHRLWCGQQHPYELAELWSKDLFVRASRAAIEELDLTACDGDTILPILSLLRVMLMPNAAFRPTLREIHKFHPIFSQRKRILLKKRNLHSLLGEIEQYKRSHPDTTPSDTLHSPLNPPSPK